MFSTFLHFGDVIFSVEHTDFIFFFLPLSRTFLKSVVSQFLLYCWKVYNVSYTIRSYRRFDFFYLQNSCSAITHNGKYLELHLKSCVCDCG